jgi:hypothetical protein
MRGEGDHRGGASDENDAGLCEMSISSALQTDRLDFDLPT